MSIRELPDAKPVVENDIITLIAFLPGFFSTQECHNITMLGAAENQYDGHVGKGVSSTIRNSKVSYVNPGKNSNWVFDKLEKILLELNGNYKFELNGFREGFQVAEYAAPGGHYSWHNDIGTGLFSTRKLSMSIQLSGADDYEGGELQFADSTAPAPKEIGSLIVFPSYLAHRVKPVTSGIRKSMVSWVSGPAFR
ncbi:MAG: 2OG-Fe(II) oxygenase [Planctomycetota bacterium]|jgi:PKHD-type hydroxylase